MFNDANKNKVDDFVNQSAAILEAILTEKQQKIEEETGEKLSLEEVFGLYRNVILGKEPEDEIVLPGKYPGNFPEGIPGFRFENEPCYFLPDLPTLYALRNWYRAFYPKTGYTDEEAYELTKLYLDPKFQRVASCLQGRLLIIAKAEGLSREEFSRSVNEERFDVIFYLHSTHDFTDEDEVLFQKVLSIYGEKYGEHWIRQNELPLGLELLDKDFISDRIANEVWWEQAASLLACENNTSSFLGIPSEIVNRKLRWMFNQPKFKSMSKTLGGRLDLICAMELRVPEDIAEELEMDLKVLRLTEENHDQIVERLIERYGNQYGAVWLAFGLEALGTGFASHAIAEDMRFLRRVPALFRNSNRYATLRPASKDETLAGIEGEDGRACLVCSQSIEGRVDKRFCSKRCQRSYYRNAVKQQYLDEMQEEAENDVDESEEKQQPEKKPDGFSGILGETLGGYVNAAAGMLLERGVDYVAGKMFGDK